MLLVRSTLSGFRFGRRRCWVPLTRAGWRFAGFHAGFRGSSINSAVGASGFAWCLFAA